MMQTLFEQYAFFEQLFRCAVAPGHRIKPTPTLSMFNIIADQQSKEEKNQEEDSDDDDSAPSRVCCIHPRDEPAPEIGRKSAREAQGPDGSPKKQRSGFS